MQKNNMPALLGALALAMAAPASAALYRCGNVFQDRPCEGAPPEAPRPGPAVPAAQRPASAPAPAAHESAPAPAAPPEEPAAARPPASGTVVILRKGPPSLACGNLREQQHAIVARLQAGGRPETVNMYQRQLRGVEENLEQGNCPR